MTTEFKELIERHRHRVYTFAYYNLGNREEAEDVTQEVLVRLWRNWQDLNQETVSAWITRVTKNLCIDVVRKRKNYSLRVVGTVGDEDYVFGTSNEPSPDAVAETSELRTEIKAALTRIQEPYRSILIFREIQDMKYEQIGVALSLPLNTVKSYLHRARKMLREQLKGIARNDYF